MIIKKIQEHFKLFPVSSRDQLLKRFYEGDLKAVRKLNDKLRKLVDRKVLEVNREIKPYVYFSTPRCIHLRSNHLKHHLSVVDFYLWMTVDQGKEVEVVALEHPLGRNLPRPDLIIKWKGIKHHVELQRTIITDSQMNKKIKGYEDALIQGKIKSDEIIWIVSPRTYNITSPYLQVVQTNTIQNKVPLT